MNKVISRFWLMRAMIALFAMGTALASGTAGVSPGEGACPMTAQGPATPMPGAGLALATHNAERAGLGLPPLAWSCRLQDDAAAWAQVLAQRGQLQHAAREVLHGSGENLWMGTAGRWSVGEMVTRFIDEKQHFRAGRFPDVSRTGNWADVGHYSQVVWRDTREVGCALAKGDTREVLVCRYFPAGNVMGRETF